MIEKNKKTGKRHKIQRLFLLLIITFLLLAVTRMYLFPAAPSCQDYGVHFFYATRNGVVYDPWILSSEIQRREIFISSFDSLNKGRNINRLISETPATYDCLALDYLTDSPSSKQAADDASYSPTHGYALETYDKKSNSLVSRQSLVTRPEEQELVPPVVFSADLILFDVRRPMKESEDSVYDELFWLKRQNDKWQEIPLDSGTPDSVLLGWEKLDQYGLVFLLVHSISENANHLVSYDYRNLTVLKNVRLDKSFSNKDVCFRILTGEESLLVYRIENKETNNCSELYSIAYSVNELTPVKKFEVIVFDGTTRPRSSAIVASPNLRYVALGRTDNTYVYDDECKKVFTLRRPDVMFWNGHMVGLRRQWSWNAPVGIMIDDTFSLAFSEDSATLYDANYADNLFLWDMTTKKMLRMVTGEKGSQTRSVAF